MNMNFFLSFFHLPYFASYFRLVRFIENFLIVFEIPRCSLMWIWMKGLTRDSVHKGKKYSVPFSPSV